MLHQLRSEKHDSPGYGGRAPSPSLQANEYTHQDSKKRDRKLTPTKQTGRGHGRRNNSSPMEHGDNTHLADYENDYGSSTSFTDIDHSKAESRTGMEIDKHWKNGDSEDILTCRGLLDMDAASTGTEFLTQEAPIEHNSLPVREAKLKNV